MLDMFFSNSLKLSLPTTTSKYKNLVEKINSREKDLRKLKDKELKSLVEPLRERLIREGSKNSEVQVEAFSLVREATFRVLGIRHYDVQLVGGIVLNEGQIAEMKTGEGKTIVALLPTFLNALYGKGVHVITVNEYLARRDAEYVGRVHKFLGLSVGLIQSEMGPEERKQNYQCDVVYLTNNELGFDYLRDNLAFTKNDIVQRPFFYCVVDEIDSVLIDEARTPLIISGPTKSPVDKYKKSTKLANALQKDIHYLVDEKNQNATLLEEGIQICEQALSVSDLYSAEDPWIPYLLNSIKAKELFKLNTHYILSSEKEVIIVDEFTGRTMEGRRWGDGLHQAVEAKENVPIQDEAQTLASITYQNLFLLYEKLSGMTGTAKTEEGEFERIYNLKTVTIPTHRPLKRKDFPDVIYKNQYLKWQAIARECSEINALGRPILIGTTTIEKSELLATLLEEYDIPYRLLNAKPENVESEADIIAQAGAFKAVTIATNMAGRGTDIILGGNAEYSIKAQLKKFIKKLPSASDKELLRNETENNHLGKFLPFFEQIDKAWFEDEINIKKLEAVLNNENLEDVSDNILNKFNTLLREIIEEQLKLQESEKRKVAELGGLHVIGTERHESRRIDNQLRGRSGRQGDKGSSRMFLSLDDRIVRLFGGENIVNMMENLGLDDDTPIQSPILNKSLDSAQKKIESYYFDARKQLFEYDEALNIQRNGIYTERKRVLEAVSLRDWIIEYGERTLYDISVATKNSDSLGSKNNLFYHSLNQITGLHYNFVLAKKEVEIEQTDIALKQSFEVLYELKELQLETIENGLMRELEQSFLLQQVDKAWQEHLQKITALKDSIRWRAYGQRDPLTEYKKESYNLFVAMLIQIRHRVVYLIMRSRVFMEQS